MLVWGFGLCLFLFLLSAEYSAVICGAWPGTYSDLTVALSHSDILLCSETLVSEFRYESCVGVTGSRIVPGQDDCAGARDMAAYVWDGYAAFRQPKFDCGCCEMLVFRLCGVRQNLYVFSLYRNPDLDDQIFFDCLLASMAAVKTEDIRASLGIIRSGHHQEWLGSTTTNRHGVGAFDFATISGCDQLVVGP